MSFDTKNIRKHPKSTILAVAVFVAVMVPVFTGQAKFSEISPVLIVLIPLLLYGKDRGGPPSGGLGGTVVNGSQLAFLSLVLLSSCVTRERCLNKFGSLSETQTKVDTVQIIAPPDTVSGSISSQQILQAFQDAQLDTLLKHQQGRAKVRVIYVPKVREVQVAAECAPDTIDHYITRTVTKELVPRPWDYAQLYARKLRVGLLWLVIAIALLFGLYLIFKLLRP